jgi:glycine/D-amino acid oxidase-like deaminating enzyme
MLDLSLLGARQSTNRKRWQALKSLFHPLSPLCDQVVGGIFYPEAATINPYQFGAEMAERAERHGAKLLTATNVIASRTADNRTRGI